MTQLSKNSDEILSVREVIALSMKHQSLNSLKIIQEKVDLESFKIKQKNYDELKQIEILKHNCFHLANLVAKVARFCEKEEHNLPISNDEIINEVIPDLIIYALQLSNLFDVNLEQKYQERVDFVLQKLDPSGN